MIYSASRRTDLVAFFPEFIVQKVRRSRKLEAIVFWTKDPRPLAERADLRAVVDAVPAVVQLTVTGLAGTYWEPRVPDPACFTDALADLAARLPPGAIVWRFDPILHTPDLFDRFDRVHALLRAALGPLTEVTISFPDAYRKVMRRLARDNRHLPCPAPSEERQIASALHARSGLTLHACCEPHLTDLAGVVPARCVDAGRFDRLYGTQLGGLATDRGQRADCGCSQSTDIGSYDQRCGHNCRYCYARPETDRTADAPPGAGKP